MKIHINRAGQSLGQFTPEELRAGYREGKFAATDLAWRDGMPMWKPLREVIDEIAPESTALDTGLVAQAPGAVAGFPWEQRAERGFLGALVETIRMVLLEPTRAFRSMPPMGGWGAPLFFFVLCATIGGVAGLGYQAVLNMLSPAAAGSPHQKVLTEALASTAVLGGTIMILPFFFAAAAFLTAALTHLGLMIVGGAKKSFEATFRVTCYAGGATAVLQLVPMCGAMLYWIWSMVATVTGLSEVHGIGKGRALVAVLLPSIVCCGLIAAGAVLLVGVLESAGK